MEDVLSAIPDVEHHVRKHVSVCWDTQWPMVKCLRRSETSSTALDRLLEPMERGRLFGRKERRKSSRGWLRLRIF